MDEQIERVEELRHELLDRLSVLAHLHGWMIRGHGGYPHCSPELRARISAIDTELNAVYQQAGKEFLGRDVL